MDSVKKNKSLVAIIIFLLVSNIAMLVFFLALGNSNTRDHSRKDMVSNFLKKDIGFNQKQLDDYEKIHKDHWEKMRPYFKGIRSAKDSFYNLLYISPADSSVNKAAAIIGEKQMALDVQMFEHFKNVRSLCTSEQLPKFDSLFKGIVSRMTGHVRKPDSRGK